MPDYTVRVELHGATHAEYDQLHQAMRTAGFYTAIGGENGQGFRLPTAEYVVDASPLSVTEIRDLVLKIATLVKPMPPPLVLATQSLVRAWQLRPT
jgi:hypothetical protein